MATTTKDQQIILKNIQLENLETCVEAFLIDRKVGGCSPGTLGFYNEKLGKFLNYCDAQVITNILQITPNFIRQYLLYLEDVGHNSGGIHAHFRSLRTFLNWWEFEFDYDDWKNPIRKVKPPKLIVEPLMPVELIDIHTMIKSCDRNFFGLRDQAILLTLLDTGVRAQEFININQTDLNLVTGEIHIRCGKGSKSRSVYLGKKSRKAVRSFQKLRSDDCLALWVTKDGDRLSYWGLRQIIRRRAKKVGVEIPSLHSFRRAFALNMLRAGVDIFSLQKLMGHADLQVLRRYLAQTTDDIAAAHRIGSPVDRSF